MGRRDEDPRRGGQVRPPSPRGLRSAEQRSACGHGSTSLRSSRSIGSPSILPRDRRRRYEDVAFAVSDQEKAVSNRRGSDIHADEDVQPIAILPQASNLHFEEVARFAEGVHGLFGDEGLQHLTLVLLHILLLCALLCRWHCFPPRFSLVRSDGHSRLQLLSPHVLAVSSREQEGDPQWSTSTLSRLCRLAVAVRGYAKTPPPPPPRNGEGESRRPLWLAPPPRCGGGGGE